MYNIHNFHNFEFSSDMRRRRYNLRSRRRYNVIREHLKINSFVLNMTAN